jgi:hypothetical protein
MLFASDREHEKPPALQRSGAPSHIPDATSQRIHATGHIEGATAQIGYAPSQD